MSKTKAAVIQNVGELVYQEFDIPELKDYEVLFQVKAVSLCTVEQRAYLGLKNFKYPFIGGHENSGVVVAVGRGVVEFAVGDKAISTFQYCGQCEYCKTGRGTKCLHSRKGGKRIQFEGGIVGGAMAEYLVIPAWQLVKISPDANFDHAALTEPLACCVHSIEKTNIKFGETVLIIGSGIMGYLHLKLALMKGARVIVSEVDDARREKALKGGAHYGINPAKEDAVQRVRELTNGIGADVVINTISNPAVWSSAIEMLAPYGRLVAYSSQDNNEPVGISFGELHNKEQIFIGTVSPTQEANLRAAKLIDYKLIDMEEVIDSRYSFDQADEAFKRAVQPNTYRVVIKYE